MQKLRSSSSAEEVAGSIDTLSEILLRLPAKSLLQLKCVCKQWLTLISDPNFCHSHSLHNSTPCALLLSYSHNLYVLPLTPTSPTRLLSLDFLNRPHLSVVRSCNGLLLCHSNSTYFVCNPTTRKFHTLTLPSPHQPRALYLAFDPSTSPHYQLLSLQTLHSQNSHQVPCVFHVYSSKTRSWTHPQASFTAPSEIITASGVYCKGAIHWCNDADSSLYFNIDDMSLRYWPMPLSDYEWCNRRVDYFGQCGGRLHLIISIINQPLEFHVYEGKQDYSAWLLKHHVDVNPMRVEFPELRWGWANWALPFYIACPVEEEKSMLILLLGGTVLSYCPWNRTWRRACEFWPGMTIYDAMAVYMLGPVFQYFENFSSLQT
ncbi:F-box protein At5g07610-like [Abrus precatorius]|uniref:F-box protein At5g07610-like n=1 Tax=Abrus precatorius TaxID=3816 RepID=A0A8B8L8Y9_ABRPR|nr:F-box protein At5g07610-like [Abrus precatorius]